jgi:hypothetical protein
VPSRKSFLENLFDALRRRYRGRQSSTQAVVLPTRPRIGGQAANLFEMTRRG